MGIQNASLSFWLFNNRAKSSNDSTRKRSSTGFCTMDLNSSLSTSSPMPTTITCESKVFLAQRLGPFINEDNSEQWYGEQTSGNRTTGRLRHGFGV